MCKRMYKVFSSGISMPYSHELPVVPFSLFRPPPAENQLCSSNPPSVTRRTARQAGRIPQGGIKINPQESARKPSKTRAEPDPSGKKKRKFVVSSDEEAGNNDDGDDNAAPPPPPPPPSRTPTRFGRTKSASKIRRSSRKPQDIDPMGKTPDPTHNADVTNQGGETAHKSRLDAMTTRLKELELSHEKLAEEKAVAEKETEDFKYQLSDTATQLADLEKDHYNVVKEKESLEEAFASYKKETEAKMDLMSRKLKAPQEVRKDVANMATPLINALYTNGEGPSFLEPEEVFEKLVTTPEKFLKEVHEAATMGASQALAMAKSLYPRIDVNAVGEGYADGITDEQALELINEA